MPQEEQRNPASPEAKRGGPSRDEELLPTISLVHIPHGKIRNLYQCCFEYIEPWQWSAEAERVETGRWFFGSETTEL
jgi:hypothetical protein